MQTQFLAVMILSALGCSSWANAQTFIHEHSEQNDGNSQDEVKPGALIIGSDKLQLGIKFMAGYGFDGAQSTLGLEKQGRIGHVIFRATGKLTKRLNYRLEINPVNETEPRVSCGEENYYYPNAAADLGPKVACNNDGRIMVDDYRFKGLDVVPQQGPVRQAYLAFDSDSWGFKFGRFLLPLGFDWEQLGSLSSKDATHIQRINSEGSFGGEVYYSIGNPHTRFMKIMADIVTGDGNRFHDYDYFYGLDGSMDANSWQALILAVQTKPLSKLEIRSSYKRGDTGSKIERLPNFFASKRHDDAVVVSLKYSPVKFLSVFGEQVQYTWGLTKSSAHLLGVEGSPVKKGGYYYGGDFSIPLGHSIRLGTVITREELSRDDALVKYLSEQGLYRVRMGKVERSNVIRVYLDTGSAVRVGVYNNDLSNPYPWLSGIVPVAGPNAYQDKRGSRKWGVIVQFRVE